MPPAPPRPPGALPPTMPPPRRRLPPAAHLPPRTFHSYLPRSHRTYSCVHCRAHLARHEELISKVPTNPPAGQLSPTGRLGQPASIRPSPAVALGWPRVSDHHPVVSPGQSASSQGGPGTVTARRGPPDDVPEAVSFFPRWHWDSQHLPRGATGVGSVPPWCPQGGEHPPTVSPGWRVAWWQCSGAGGRGWPRGHRAKPVTRAMSPQSFQGSHGRAYLFNSV